MHILDAYPRGYRNPVTFRASAALPAAGAWDAAPTETPSTNAESLSLSITYTRGAVGGAFDFQLEYSIYSVAALVPAGAAEWATMGLNAPGIVALGADTQSRIQREYITYGSQGAAAEDFTCVVKLFRGVERIRIRARESADGIIANPGTLSLVGNLI